MISKNTQRTKNNANLKDTINNPHALRNNRKRRKKLERRISKDSNEDEISRLTVVDDEDEGAITHEGRRWRRLRPGERHEHRRRRRLRALLRDLQRRLVERAAHHQASSGRQAGQVGRLAEQLPDAEFIQGLGTMRETKTLDIINNYPGK